MAALSSALIGDFFASIAPGYLTFGLGAAFSFTKFLKPEFAIAFASYAHSIGLPAVVFKRLALDDPSALDVRLLGADALSKFIPLFFLLLWWRFFSKHGKRESFEWVIIFFVLSTFPNTVLVGETFLSPMFGLWVNAETRVIEFAQALYWYGLVIMLLEIRELMLEDEQEKSPLAVVPGWKAKGEYVDKQHDFSFFKARAVDNVAQGSNDGGQRNFGRRICVSIHKFLFNPRVEISVPAAAWKHEAADGLPRSYMSNMFHSPSKVAPMSQLDGAGAQVGGVVALSPEPGGSAGKADHATTDHGQLHPTDSSVAIVDVKNPKANFNLDVASQNWFTVDLDNPGLTEADGNVASPSFPDAVCSVEYSLEQQQQPGYDGSGEKTPRTVAQGTAADPATTKSSWPGYNDMGKPWNAEGSGKKVLDSATKSFWLGYDDLQKPPPAGKGGKAAAAAAENSSKSYRPRYDDLKRPSTTVRPPSTDWPWPGFKVIAHQVFRLVKRMLRVPVTFASLMGLFFALMGFHEKFKLPHFLGKTLDVLGGGTIGMSFIVLGMTFAKNILDGRGVIPCGTKLLLAGFAARFIAAPVIMFLSSEIVRLKGSLLTYAVVQVLVPQGTIAFSLAVFYDFKPSIMGTAIYTQMLIFIPISMAYYAVLEAM